MYRPSQEKDVVLKCGCITTSYGAINTKLEGKKNEEQWCERHEQWITIRREANVYERYNFYVNGKSAPARASNRTLAGLFGMPDDSTAKQDSADRARYDQQALFGLSGHYPKVGRE
jgi:hypothetical protein